MVVCSILFPRDIRRNALLTSTWCFCEEQSELCSNPGSHLILGAIKLEVMPTCLVAGNELHYKNAHDALEHRGTRLSRRLRVHDGYKPLGITTSGKKNAWLLSGSANLYYKTILGLIATTTWSEILMWSIYDLISTTIYSTMHHWWVPVTVFELSLMINLISRNLSS
jgi:hypothetical protein